MAGRRQGASRADVAKAFGVTLKTVDNYGRNGWLVRFPDRSIDVEATRERVAESKRAQGRPAGTGSGEKLAAEIEKLRLGNEKMALEIEKIRGSHIEKAKALRVCRGVVQVVSQKHANAPARWADKIAQAGTDPADIRMALEDLFREMDEELANEPEPDFS